MNTQDMITLPYSQTFRPFGKVNVWHLPDGSKRVRAYLLMEHIREGTQTGIGIEGSSLMKQAFGLKGRIGPWFARQSGANLVSMTAQKISSYLARKVDTDRRTTIIYWATGPSGSDIEHVGDLTAYQAEQYDFGMPQGFGSGVKLLPAVRYFVERFVDAKWGMYVFITQGSIEDLEAVKQYTTQLASAIAAGQRNNLKLILIGVGRKINKSHLEQLDNLVTGTNVDLWDYKIAAEMKSLAVKELTPTFGLKRSSERAKLHFSEPILELFAEVVDENTMVAETGCVLDATGEVVADFSNKGVPALLNFVLPPGSSSFSFKLPDGCITQPIL